MQSKSHSLRHGTAPQTKSNVGDGPKPHLTPHRCLCTSCQAVSDRKGRLGWYVCCVIVSTTKDKFAGPPGHSLYRWRSIHGSRPTHVKTTKKSHKDLGNLEMGSTLGNTNRSRKTMAQTTVRKRAALPSSRRRLFIGVAAQKIQSVQDVVHSCSAIACTLFPCVQGLVYNNHCVSTSSLGRRHPICCPPSCSPLATTG